MESNKYIPETFFFCYCFFSAVVVICRHNFYLLFSLKISDLHLWGNKKYGKTISSHFRSLGLWERGKYRFSSTGLASKSTSSVIFIFFFSWFSEVLCLPAVPLVFWHGTPTKSIIAIWRDHLHIHFLMVKEHNEMFREQAACFSFQKPHSLSEKRWLPHSKGTQVVKPAEDGCNLPCWT